jgi:hypothetical protein
MTPSDPRTPTMPNRAGMEGITGLGGGWFLPKGSGGNHSGSRGCDGLGGYGEDGGDNCDPPHARAYLKGCGGQKRSFYVRERFIPSILSIPSIFLLGC